MNHGTIEITVGEVSGMAARVRARYTGPDNVELRGTLRGPFCESARTLQAEFPFRDLGPDRPGNAEAVIVDPCLWSEELPHMYRAEIEAVCDSKVVGTFRGSIGLRGELIVHEYEQPRDA